MPTDISRAVNLLRPAATNKVLQAALDRVLSWQKLNDDSPVEDYQSVQKAFAMDLVSLHRGCARQVFHLSALVFSSAVEERIRPSLENDHATCNLELVLAGIIAGAAKYIESSKPDLEMIGKELFKPLLVLLELHGANKLSGALLREAIALLDDAGCKANYELLRNPRVLSAARFGRIVANHNNYLCLQSLFDILPRILPSSKAQKNKAAYLKSLFDGPDTRHAFSSTKRGELRQAVMDATPEGWPQIVHDILSAMAICNKDKPQPIAVSVISVSGRPMGVEGQQEVLYLDTDAFRVCVATATEDVLEDLEVPYCSVRSIRFQQLKGSMKMIAVAVGLSAPPALSCAPVTTSEDFTSTPTSPHKFCFRVRPEDIDRLCELLTTRELPYDDNGLDFPAPRQNKMTVEPLKFEKRHHTAGNLQNNDRLQPDTLPSSSSRLRTIASTKKFSISEEVALNPTVPLDQLQKWAREEMDFFERSSPAPVVLEEKILVPDSPDQAPVSQVTNLGARPESALSAVDDDAAAAAVEYVEKLRSSVSPPSSPPHQPSPSPATRNTKGVASSLAPKVSKPAAKRSAATQTCVKKTGKEQENVAAAKVAKQGNNRTDKAAELTASKKRKVVDRDDAEDEVQPVAKRTRQERPPVLRTYNSQQLLPTSSPPRTKYKSAKAKRKIVVSSDEDGAYSPSINFDQIPQSDAAPEPAKPTADKSKTRAPAAKAKKAAPVAAPSSPTMPASTAAAPTTTAVPAQHQGIIEAKPKVDAKAKSKSKPKSKPKAPLRKEPQETDNDLPAAPKAAKTKGRGRQVVDEDDGEELPRATELKKPQTPPVARRGVPSKAKGADIPCVPTPEPAPKTLPVLARPLDVPSVTSPHTNHRTPHLDDSIPKISADASFDDDFERFVNLSPILPVSNHNAPEADPIATSTPIRPTTSSALPVARSRKSKKAPWECSQFDTGGFSEPQVSEDAEAEPCSSNLATVAKPTSVSASLARAPSVSTATRSNSADRSLSHHSVGRPLPPSTIPPLEMDVDDPHLVISIITGQASEGRTTSIASVGPSAPPCLTALDQPAEHMNEPTVTKSQAAFIKNGLLTENGLLQSRVRVPERARVPNPTSILSSSPQESSDATLRPAAAGGPAAELPPLFSDEYTRAVDDFMRQDQNTSRAYKPAEPIKLQSALKSPLIVKPAQKTQKVTFALEPPTTRVAQSPRPLGIHQRLQDPSPTFGTPRQEYDRAKLAPRKFTFFGPARDADDLEEPVTQDAHLAKILSIMGEMHKVIASRVATNFETVDRGPSEKACELLRIVLDNAVEMREESVEQYNKIIDLEEDYGRFGSAHAQKLGEVVKVDRELSRTMAQIIQDHDRGSLVKKMPTTLFSGPLPACFNRV